MSEANKSRSQPKSSGNFKIAKDAVVCSEAQLVGDVTIGSRTVIHPTARILAEGGPIVIGDNNLIQEKVTIINSKPSNVESSNVRCMIIGNGNVFEVGAYSESMVVGDSNTFEAKSRVSRVTAISSHCVIGAGCSLDSAETIPPDTMICGRENRQFTMKSVHSSNQQQLDLLIKMLPNYHRLTKSVQPA